MRIIAILPVVGSTNEKHEKEHTVARKVSTIKVGEVKELLQGMIDHAQSEEARLALASALSDILMRTGNYRGFNYRYWLSTGYEEWLGAGRPDSTEPYLGDQSKVTFY